VIERSAPASIGVRRALTAEATASGPELSYVPTPSRAGHSRLLERHAGCQGTKLRLALKIGRAADGKFSGTMDSLDQGARRFP
jgi:hypothetical protein